MGSRCAQFLKIVSDPANMAAENCPNINVMVASVNKVQLQPPERDIGEVWYENSCKSKQEEAP